VFDTPLDEKAVKAALESALAAHAGKPIPVLIRTAEEMAAIVLNNPYAVLAPHRTLVIFLDEPPGSDALTQVTGQKNERLCLGAREIYVHYDEGMASSKLKIKAGQWGTARNMNSVAKLAQMAAAS
jgi:uncharacterized protein (DUF1697 family)